MIQSNQVTFTCSKSTIETLPNFTTNTGVFTVNFEHISQLFLMFLLLTLNNSMLAGKVILTLLLHATVVLHFTSLCRFEQPYSYLAEINYSANTVFITENQTFEIFKVVITSRR